jgi:hypothetical protein
MVGAMLAALSRTLLLLATLGGCIEPVVVLKSGTVLEGEVERVDAGILAVRDAAGEELPLARLNVRSIEGEGPHADPPLLWREVPASARGAAPTSFVRAVRNADGTGSLDVGIGALQDPATGRRVYLVGAVHIAHRECFVALQSVLDAQDVVLWEGVGGKEKPTEEALERFDVLFKTQVLLKNILNLDFQLQEVDYERSFWRNCDMSVNDLQAELDARGLQIMPNEELFRALFGTLFKLVDPHAIPRSEAMGRPYRAMLAPLMSDPDRIFSQAGAEGLKVVLIDLRNRVVVDEVERLLDDPAGPQRIGVFYGAGHLTGMLAALQAERGLQYLGTHWIPAWRF